MKRRTLGGSLIGGIAETQECSISAPSTDRVRHRDDRDPADRRGYDRMARGDVKYRFVIDNSSLAAG
jgi:uncharacterized zinc-type alcohol dehydrogenase-like protein